MNEITISSMLPAVRNTALMRGKTYIGIDFGTSTTVVSIVSYDEYDHKIHTKSLRLPQMLPDGTLYRSEIVPTVIAWLNGCILVGEGASQMKYQLKKGKNIWYSFKSSDIYNHSLFISLSSVAIGVNSVPLAPTTIYHHWLRLRAFAEIYLYIVPICQRTNQ